MQSYICTNTHTLPNILAKLCHSFRVTWINTQSHTVIHIGLSHGPTYWSPLPPQTQLFFPAFRFPKDWIPQLRVVGLGIRLHAQGSRSKGIQDGSHLLGQGTRKPHVITLAAPGQAMPAPLGTGPLPQNLNRPCAQLNITFPAAGPRERQREKKGEGGTSCQSHLLDIHRLGPNSPWHNRH